MEIAHAGPTSVAELPQGHRPIARYGRQWVAAVRTALDLPEAELPERVVRSDGPPPQRSWADKNPRAAARLTATRTLLTAFAAERLPAFE